METSVNGTVGWRCRCYSKVGVQVGSWLQVLGGRKGLNDVVGWRNTVNIAVHHLVTTHFNVELEVMGDQTAGTESHEERCQYKRSAG